MRVRIPRVRPSRTMRRRLHTLGEELRALTRLSPARMAVAVFTGLILLFSFLLMLPFSSASGEVTPFVHALFTAVSTICVTGLTTLDMSTHWSPFGYGVIFVGVQVGALGVLTLASFLGLTFSRRLGLRARLTAARDSGLVSRDKRVGTTGATVNLNEVGVLLRIVALTTIITEISIAVLLYPLMLLERIDPLTALWEAPYYAAMAFTNTGFTPNAGGLQPFMDNHAILLLLMAGVFLGSIGFPVFVALRRHLFEPHRWSLHVKLTLVTTVLLFFAGAGMFLLLEFDNPATFGSMDLGDTVFQSFFLSAMTRSGGFSVVDPSHMENSSLLVACMLMFVGGGSASTAGGIKVTTLAVLALAVIGEARGRTSVEAFGRRIPSDVQRVAISVVAWGATIVAASTIAIAHISKAPLQDVLFDVISGFATVGLSTGVTGNLPDLGVYIMSATMFLGRVGTVTIAAAVAATARPQQYALPVERPIVG